VCSLSDHALQWQHTARSHIVTITLTEQYSTVQYSNCGRGSLTSALASEPRAHGGAHRKCKCINKPPKQLTPPEHTSQAASAMRQHGQPMYSPTLMAGIAPGGGCIIRYKTRPYCTKHCYMALSDPPGVPPARRTMHKHNWGAGAGRGSRQGRLPALSWRHSDICHSVTSGRQRSVQDLQTGDRNMCACALQMPETI
jgi:hypothetical protein